MKLRGKLTLWLSILLVLAVTFFIVPAVSGSSWGDIFGEWLDEYSQAVEKAQEEEDDHDDEIALPIGDRVVLLDDEANDYAGIETRILERSSYFPEKKAQARVMNVRALLDIRSQYKQASAALKVA